ncbi:unnamed protein product, partial [Mesorhabditis belari]|uniref:ILCR1 Ig-like domain-containing protein n=1 Tax=Mesorhabditis belari TaxID=2138241 RepID=A0AAF3FN70_9BILA
MRHPLRNGFPRIVLSLILLFACILSSIQTALVLDPECSTKPQIIACHFQNNSNFSTNAQLVDWGDLAPEDVGIFDLIKPNTTSGALAVESRIRWRLPIGALQQPLLGFEIVITEKHVSNPMKTVFYTNLNKSISRVNNAMQHGEFYIKARGLFKFGHLYDVQISFLPKGETGQTWLEKSVPPWLENVNCDRNELKVMRMRKDRTITPSFFASMWSSAFQSIKIYQGVMGKVNVTFATAPKELCISSYKLRLRNIETDQTLILLRIEAEPGIFAWNLFEGLPPEVYYTVEIVPDNNDDGTCPCANCNCVTTSSKPFKVNHYEEPEVPRETFNAVINPHSNDPLWIFALILLVVVVAALFILIALLGFYHRKLINTERHIKLSFGPKLDPEALPVKSFKELVRKTILVIDRCYTERENQLCEGLAKSLSISGVRIRFEKWEKSQVEENVFQWISEVLREADKILMVYGKDWDESVRPIQETQILSLIKQTDPRLIHASWCHTMSSSPFVETVYNLPRHAPLLCGLLNVKFKLETWKPLIDACEKQNGYGNGQTDSLTHENESERVALLGEKCDSGVDEIEIEDPSDPIYPSSTISASLHIVPTNAPPREADSAYASMNTAEIS